MGYSSEYVEYVKSEIRKILNKPFERITTTDITNRAEAKGCAVRSRANRNDSNIYYWTKEIDLSNDKNGQKISSATIARNLEQGNLKKLIPLLTKIFDLQSEKDFTPKPKSIDFWHHDAHSQAERSYDWEMSLFSLIDGLFNPKNITLTISIDDLSFVFRIIPSLIHFIFNRKGKVYLLYAPRSAYALMASRELLLLWKLGVDIRILDYKESLSERNEIGFIFNWIPKDKEVKSDKIFRDGIISMIRLRTGNFDRYPFSTIIRPDVQHKEIADSISNILTKHAKSGLNLIRQTCTPFSIEKEQYIKWVEKIFLEDPRLEAFRGCKCSFAFIPIKDIYYRHKWFSRFKLYQHYKLITETKLNGNIAPAYQAYNLFLNGTRGYYPICPPILERNHTKNRWEMATGNHRVLASYLLNPKDSVWVLTVEGMDSKWFKPLVQVENSDRIITDNWGEAMDRLKDLVRESSLIYPSRDLEGVLHEFDYSAYKDLGDALMPRFIKNKAEAAYYSHEKYPIKKVRG